MQNRRDIRTQQEFNGPSVSSSMMSIKRPARPSSSSSSSSWASTSAVDAKNNVNGCSNNNNKRKFKLRNSKKKTKQRPDAHDKQRLLSSSSSSSDDDDAISMTNKKRLNCNNSWGLTVKPQPPPIVNIMTFQQPSSSAMFGGFGVCPPPPPPPVPQVGNSHQPLSDTSSSFTASTMSGSSHSIQWSTPVWPPPLIRPDGYMPDKNTQHYNYQRPLPQHQQQYRFEASTSSTSTTYFVSARGSPPKPQFNAAPQRDHGSKAGCSTSAGGSADIAQKPTVIGKKSLPQISEGWGVGSVLNYEIISQVGEGTYGQVYKAVERKSRRMVALKKVRLENEKEGFPITAVREIKILRQLDHPNIVKLLDIVTENDLRSESSAFYLVFEYVDHDLMGLIESQLITLTEMQIASFMKQLLLALDYSHSHNFLHRDLKCSNILINNSGQLKLADFGLARFYHENHQRLYTNRVITLWYRPPELLLGEERYGPAVDIWSVGCILAELFVRRPLFQGTSEFFQLELISQICGTPAPSNWPGVENLAQYEMIRPRRSYPRVLRQRFSFMPSPTIDLLDRMLTLAPERRVTAGEALRHVWLANVNPALVAPPELPRHQDCHEMWCKQEKKKRMMQML